MLICSLFSIIIVNEFEPTVYIKNKLKRIKNIKTHFLIDIPIYIIYKLLSCPSCLSYWIFGFTYLIMLSSGLGFVLGCIVYYLTFILNRLIYKTKV